MEKSYYAMQKHCTALHFSLVPVVFQALFYAFFHLIS